MPFFLLPVAALAGLSACGPQVHAPSLAPRPVEKLPINPPAEPSETDTPADPGLAARIAPLVEAARAGDAAFAGQRTETEAAVAKAGGAGEGSEAWIVAQQALSALDTARGPVRDAVAAIEAMRVEPANAAPRNRAAIESAARTIEALDDAEAATVAALAAKLGG